MKMIQLTKSQWAKVDDEDFDFLSTFKWHVRFNRRNKYAITMMCNKSVSMHRLLLSAERGEVVDHINHDGLDNRRSNIRIVTGSMNQYNRLPNDNCASQFKGVIKNRKKWSSQIKVNGRSIYLGSYDDEVLAAKIYNTAAEYFFGKHACLNRF